MARWTKDDEAALRRLVDRHGAAGVAERAKASGKGRGHPPGKWQDALTAWTAVESLMRRDGASKSAACERIADFAKRFLAARVKGYGASSLAKLHTEAERYYATRPVQRAADDRDIAAWIAANPDKAVLRLPLRGPEAEKLIISKYGAPPFMARLTNVILNGRDGPRGK